MLAVHDGEATTYTWPASRSINNPVLVSTMLYTIAQSAVRTVTHVQREKTSLISRKASRNCENQTYRILHCNLCPFRTIKSLGETQLEPCAR